MMIIGNPITLGGGGVGLNIEYGTTPPADTSKLWVPLAKKPDNVEISGDSLQSATDIAQMLDLKLNNATTNCVSTAIDGKIYIFGGGGIYVEAFDPVANTCTLTTAKMSTSANSGAGAVTIDGKAYIFAAGGNNDEILIYDPKTDTLTKSTAKTAYTTRFAGTADVGGKAYIFGGSNRSGDRSKAIYEYDPVTDTATIKSATLPSGMAGLSAAAIDGRVYIVGGGNTATTIFEYNPISDTLITKGGKLVFGCDKPFVGVINNKLYIVGGASNVSGGELNVVQEYDPFTDTCVQRSATLPNPIRQMCGGVVGDTIYVFGDWATANQNDIQSYTPSAYLDTNHLKVFASVYKTGSYQVPTNIVNDKSAQIKLYMTSAFLGDEDGYAMAQPAYVYDEANSEWQALDGTSMTTDMLAALAELGVS